MTINIDSNILSQEQILEQLPVELFAQIVYHLDHCSLRALLEAYPSLCCHFLLILDDAFDDHPTPVFFTSPSLGSLTSSEFKHSQPRTFLKIYETDLCEICDGTDDDFFASRLPALDKNSFVHCFTETYRDDSTKRVHEQEFFQTIWYEQITNKGARFELDTFRSPLTVIRPNFLNHLSPNLCAFQSLKSLRIEHCNSIKNVDFGSVKFLTVIFYDYPSLGRPQFCGVAARNIEWFTIHYSNFPPLVKDIDFGLIKRDDISKGFHQYRLAICHIPSLDSKLHSALPIYPCDTEELDFSSLTSSKKFWYVIVVGGHDQIICGLDFLETQCFVWKQAHYQSSPISLKSYGRYGTPLNLRFRPLSLISFETLIPQAYLPFSTAQLNYVMGRLMVTARNGIDLRASELDFQEKISLSINLLPIRQHGKSYDQNMPTLNIYRDIRDKDPSGRYYYPNYIDYLSVHGYVSDLAGFDWESLSHRIQEYVFPQRRD